MLIAVLGTACFGIGPASAQEATPPGTQLAGRDILLQATIADLPPSAVTLELIRITLAPGAVSQSHTHPGPEFGIVGAGTLTVRVESPAILLPAASATAEGSLATPVGEDFTLNQGDRIAYPAETVLTFRNAGDESVSLLAITILPAGPDAPPGVTWTDGTPGPDNAAGITSELLGSAVVTELPTAPVAVTLDRLALSAGDRISAYPGPALVAVEEGTLTGSVVEGAVEIARAGTGSGEANATPSAEFAIAPGEALFFPRGMSETPPLSGGGSLTLLRLGLLELPEAAAPEDDVAAPDPSGIQEGATVVVTFEDVNLRSAPSTASVTIAVVQPGQVFVITGPAVEAEGRLWWPVSDPNDPTLTGFVAAEFIAPRP